MKEKNDIKYKNLPKKEKMSRRDEITLKKIENWLKSVSFDFRSRREFSFSLG